MISNIKSRHIFNLHPQETCPESSFSYWPPHSLSISPSAAARPAVPQISHTSPPQENASSPHRPAANQLSSMTKIAKCAFARPPPPYVTTEGKCVSRASPTSWNNSTQTCLSE